MLVCYTLEQDQDKDTEKFFRLSGRKIPGRKTTGWRRMHYDCAQIAELY